MQLMQLTQSGFFSYVFLMLLGHEKQDSLYLFLSNHVKTIK